MHPAQIKACFDELSKIAEEEQKPEPNLNFFERHPKKIVAGGLGAAAGAALLYANRNKLHKAYSDYKWGQSGGFSMKEGPLHKLKDFLGKAGVGKKGPKSLAEINNVEGHLSDALKTPSPKTDLSGPKFSKPDKKAPPIQSFHRKK